MLPFRVLFVLAMTATASEQAPGVSPKCQEELKSIQPKEKATAVRSCEEKAGYRQQAIAHLQDGDRTAAISTIKENFQTCAKFSESCAKELAPRVVQQIEFSGEAVGKHCQESVAKVLNDKKKMKEVAACEQQNKVVENVLVALNKNDINAAVDAAQTSLEKCSGLEEKCARQLAPVIVNQVVLRALAEQQQQQQQQQGAPDANQITVFATASATVLGSKATGQLSLIGTAVDQSGLAVRRTAFRKKDAVSLLQKKRFVSRMIMQMAH